ncbi:MAG TPA: agmatinase family protein, partial [Saprospiraceae bacterium]|nr:agmatinase family protein [Saprospiraceae bacterium]
IYMCPSDGKILESNNQLRELAKSYIDFLENGSNLAENESMKMNLEAVNEGCENLKKWVYEQTSELLDAGKLVGLVGGEHSTPLGYLEALSERHKSFGILQIDAHMDLREAYEGFTYSHASIFYNALKIKNLKQLTQVGIRDCCEEEVRLAHHDARVSVFYDWTLKEEKFVGKTWEKICKKIVKTLPEKVYISFDIDGLLPNLCPNTGTPVPGGLTFEEAVYLLKTVLKSGRKIIGFDLCETGGEGNEWDGNVGARVLYKLANLMAASHHLNK